MSMYNHILLLDTALVYFVLHIMHISVCCLTILSMFSCISVVFFVFDWCAPLLSLMLDE